MNAKSEQQKSPVIFNLNLPHPCFQANCVLRIRIKLHSSVLDPDSGGLLDSESGSRGLKKDKSVK